IAHDAIPTLEALLDRGEPADRARVAFAIVVIDPEACERAATNLLAMLRDAAIDPRDRIQALSPLSVMLKQSKVPERVRDDVHRALLAIPDEPGLHPEFARRIREFLRYQERVRLQSTTEAVRRISFQ